MTREWESDALRTHAMQEDTGVSKPRPFRPLGPKFNAVALTPEEAKPLLVRKATVLQAEIKAVNPFKLKAS
jgi:hypothetical protein